MAKKEYTIQEIKRVLAKNSNGSLEEQTAQERIDTLETKLYELIDQHNGLCKDFEEMCAKHNELTTMICEQIKDDKKLFELISTEMDMLFLAMEHGDKIIGDERKWG